MEVTVHLDDPAVREEGFFASKVEGLLNRVRGLEYDSRVGESQRGTCRAS